MEFLQMHVNSDLNINLTHIGYDSEDVAMTQKMSI